MNERLRALLVSGGIALVSTAVQELTLGPSLTVPLSHPTDDTREES